MEILLLGIYAFFAWLIFFKFKWLPWNIVTQVITITIPIFALTALILFLNVVAPSSNDVRVINYVVAVNPRVSGLVTDVPVEPNRPVKKGDVLFKIDPTPYALAVKTIDNNIRVIQQQLEVATNKKEALNAKIALARKRVEQFRELAATGAGSKFDIEQAQTDAENLEGEIAAMASTEAQAAAEIEKAKVQRDDAKWQLAQTVYYAPANGRVVALALRPGSMAVPFPAIPAMTFVEDEQWIMAIYRQNEIRKVKPGQEAEIALKMYPGRIIKCKVDSIMWATAQGQLPIGGASTSAGIAPIPPQSLAVRLVLDEEREGDLFLASGALGNGAIYTDSGVLIQILRRIILRVGTKIDWLILKLH